MGFSCLWCLNLSSKPCSPENGTLQRYGDLTLLFWDFTQNVLNARISWIHWFLFQPIQPQCWKEEKSFKSLWHHALRYGLVVFFLLLSTEIVARGKKCLINWALYVGVVIYLWCLGSIMDMFQQINFVY